MTGTGTETRPKLGSRRVINLLFYAYNINSLIIPAGTSANLASAGKMLVKRKRRRGERLIVWLLHEYVTLNLPLNCPGSAGETRQSY